MLDFIGFINDNVNLPAAKKVALLDDFCAQYNYQVTIPGVDGLPIPNPESRQQFANHQIGRYIRDVVNATRRIEAIESIIFDELDELEQVP